jgi:hypothetical protein
MSPCLSCSVNCPKSRSRLVAWCHRPDCHRDSQIRLRLDSSKGRTLVTSWTGSLGSEICSGPRCGNDTPEGQKTGNLQRLRRPPLYKCPTLVCPAPHRQMTERCRRLLTWLLDASINQQFRGNSWQQIRSAFGIDKSYCYPTI